MRNIWRCFNPRDADLSPFATSDQPSRIPRGRRHRRPRVRRGRGMPHRHAGRWSAWFGGTDDRAVRAPGSDARGPAGGNAQRPLHRAHTVRVLPRAHRGPRRARARTALGHRGESGRAAHRAGARRRAEGEGPARTTARHPGARERQRGYRGPDGHNGSLALLGAKPPVDAFVVQRLRAAGAVLLGKANLSEWANFRSSNSSSGWSARGGQCRNPYALDRSPCGSSSGTAAGIAANFAAVGVGTETDGSIVCPSSACSLVGIKPTLGLVSRSGIVPIAHSQDTAGPMARTVSDAALLLGALAGADARDSATRRAPAPADYTKALDAGALRGARIGVVRKKFLGYNDATDRLTEQ